MSPAEDRPLDPTPVHTADLPPTPLRDRSIPAEAWVEAPAELRVLGDELEGRPPALYLRRIGGWLVWRAGPASKAHARYLAIAADDLSQQVRFSGFPDGGGQGAGPDGVVCDRFRAWKESLRDVPPV